MSKFKQKFSLLRRNTVAKDIGGQTFTFYPISVRMLFELRTNAAPLMKGLKALFAKNQSDGTQTVEETRDPMTGQVIGRVTHLGAIDPQLAKLRSEQNDAAMKEAVEAVLGESSRLLLGRVLADSLRDEFGPSPTDADINEFINDPAIDLPVLVEMLGAFFSVNAKVFGPFAERVREMVKAKMADLNPSSDPAASASDASQDDLSASEQPSASDLSRGEPS